MRKQKLSLCFAILIFFAVKSIAQEKHLISDPNYRLLVHNQFLKSKELAKGRANELLDIFKKQLYNAYLQYITDWWLCFGILELSLRTERSELSVASSA